MALTRPTAAQIVSSTIDFTDPLLRINKGQSGVNDKDIGVVFERGSDINVAVIWDESADQFAFINTTETGTTSGNVSISSYSNLRIGTLISSGLTYPTSDGTNGQVLITNGSGTLSFTDVSTNLGIAGDSGTDTVSLLNDTLTFSGTANEITTTVTDNTVTISLPDDVTIGDTLTVTGNLIVNGTTTTISTTNTTISDNLLELNSGATSNTNDSGIIIERGSTGDNAIIAWDESADKFIVGTTTATANSTGDLTITTGTLVANIEGNVTGDVTGNADTATAMSSAVTVSLTGDVTGSATFTSAGDTASISTTIAANSVALGTDTTGNYVATIAGTANEITVSGSGSESAAVTIALPDDVTIGDTLTVTGNLFVDTNTLYVDATNNAVGVGTSSPNTYGKTVSNGDIATLARGVLKFYDTDSTHYVGFRSASTVTSNVTWTLPASDGSSGQVLSTDGSGNLSWASGGAGGASSGYQTSTVTTVYGADGSNYDLAEGPNQDGDETPFSSSGTDAFGVSLGTVYDSMEPVGSIITLDYADGEAYVGA